MILHSIFYSNFMCDCNIAKSSRSSNKNCKTFYKFFVTLPILIKS